MISYLPDSSKEEHARKGEESVTAGEDSDNEVISVSKRRKVEDSEGKKDLFNSDDGKPGESSEDMEATAEDAQNGEEKHRIESSEASKEHSHEEDKSDSERNHVTKDVESHLKLKKSCKSPSDPSNIGVAQISDDEPLVGISIRALHLSC